MLPTVSGLSGETAKNILAKNGPNALPEKPPPNDLLIFFSQLKNPLVYVLLAAGGVTFFLGHIPDTVIILAAVVLNSVLGFFQERKAGRALFALKRLLTPSANVIRDGKKQKINAVNVVVGDIVVLAQGDKIPADGKLISANRLYLDEAILTGESVSVQKKVGGEVFAGTTVISGQGVFEVTITGVNTKIGSIAEKVQEISEETPLKRQIGAFSRTLVVLILVLTVIVFGMGTLRGSPAEEMFKTAVALSVSAIPEGLLISLTVVLAIGMQRILRRKGLVRNLTSAETLGGVTTICVDKTGTLTEGSMKVVNIVGKKTELALQAVIANDLDDPLVIAAFGWGKKNSEVLPQRYPRIDSIPFSSQERFFASLNKWEGQNTLFVNGAPDSLLSWSKMSDEDKKEYLRIIQNLTREGKRVIGFARKKVDSKVKKIKSEDVKSNLDFVGIIAFSDPIRSGVSEALTQAKKAGIKVIVITGDFPNTAISVMKKIGLDVKTDQILTGTELDKLTVSGVTEKLEVITLFARTTPEQKLKIVEALKTKGEVVAMMGDGVNDAPALNKADIGIVVSTASDVSKESSDLILLDSNFSTIIAAVEEGRGIFENIRKNILYLLSDAFGEIVTVIGAIILGLPLPITAIQILWINLVSDGFPSLALTIDPKRDGVMNDGPRDSGEQVVSSWMKILISIVSISSGAAALIYFLYVFRTTGDLGEARTVAFLTLGLNSLVYVFSVKNLTTPFWKANLFNNRWLLVAVMAGFLLQSLPFSNDLTRNFFQVTKLSLGQWSIAVTLSFSMFFVVEVSKVIFRLAHRDVTISKNLKSWQA